MSRVIRGGGGCRIVEDGGGGPVVRRRFHFRFPDRGGLTFRLELLMEDSEMSEKTRGEILGALEQAAVGGLPPGAELYVLAGEAADSPVDPGWKRRRVAARITCLGEMSDRQWASVPDGGGTAQ